MGFFLRRAFSSIDDKAEKDEVLALARELRDYRAAEQRSRQRLYEKLDEMKGELVECRLSVARLEASQ